MVKNTMVNGCGRDYLPAADIRENGDFAYVSRSEKVR